MEIFRKYIIAVILCISLTLVTVCIFEADDTAKQVTLGSERTVLVLGSPSERVGNDALDISCYLDKAVKIIKQAAEIAPPPVSNIYRLIEEIK